MTEESLTAALGEWLSGREIRAILERRDRMAEEIAKLVEANNESGVFRWIARRVPAWGLIRSPTSPPATTPPGPRYRAR